MIDNENGAGRDPEKRAFSGQSDHPPADADQSPEKNRDLLRDGGKAGKSTNDESGISPGDEASTLPGYG